jgi:ribosome-interacting GTPase 1
MPTNVSQPYKDAEKRYRQASETAERIACLEEMLSLIPKHKGTENLQADIKSKLSKLRKQPKKKATRTGGQSMNVDKEGAAQITLAGPGNAGKSALVAALTNARAEVAPYPGSTRVPLPGMMMYEDVGFQLVDLPPISPDYNEHWLFDAHRRADMIWLVLHAENPLSGYELVRELLAQKRIHLHHAFEQAPDELDWAWVPQPTLLVITGSDREDAAENLEILRELVDLPFPVHLCSTITGEGLDELRALTFRAANIIRIYTKQPGKDPDMERPFTVPSGTTVEDLAYRIHKDLASTMRSARIWGSGAFDGQTVNRNHVLQDRDILELKA